MKIKTFILLILLGFTIFAQNKLPNDSSLFEDVRPPESPTAEEIIDSYIQAIGGADKISAVDDRITEMSGVIQDIHIKMTIYQKKPDMFKQVIHLGEIIQQVVYDGTKGYLKINAEESEITGDELVKLKLESTLNLLLHMDSLNVTVEYGGTDTAAGRNVHKILMHLPGKEWVQYYDTETHLKVKDEKPVITPKENFIQETWYSDYRIADGIMYPFKIVQRLGKQEMEFVVTKITTNRGIENSEFRLD